MTTSPYERQRAGDTASPDPDPETHSLGDLVSRLSGDLSRLMRQELELAKTELKEEAAKAGKGAGMLGGAGVAGWICAVFLSLTAMWLLDKGMDLALAALIVAAVWAVVTAVMFSAGRAALRSVNPKPEQTIETLKEDAQWVKQQRS
jgi:uncharacterized membrane protein YqjE